MKKHLPVPLLITVDILLIGVCLCVFALFHHVLPRAGEKDLSQSVSTDQPTANTLSLPSKHFTSGSAITTNDSYKSKNVSVTTKTYEDGYVVYHLQDIYINDINCLKTAFAYDTYGSGYREKTPDLAKKNNAVCAINGDYCGNADKGVVIRNGYLYRTENVNDVCTIYKNGKMKLSTATDYDADAEIMNGAWQAWSFGPSLVSGGKVLSDLDTYGFVSQVNPRTGIGYYEPGHYVFVTVDGRSEESMGMTLYEFANLFKNLGCKEAYNLDGGRSSVMTMGSRIVNVPHEGGRATSDIVYITDSPSEAGGSK